MAERRLKQRSWQAILTHAFTRLESAVTIALAIIAIGLFPRPFPFWRWWYWLILFAAAEVMIIWTSINDAATAEKVVADMLREKYNPGSLRSTTLRTQVERGLQYREAIEHQVNKVRPGVLHDSLADTANRVDEWLSQVCLLAQRLDNLAGDTIVQRDLQAAPEAIRNYHYRLQNAKDEQVRAQLQEALTAKEEHLANMRQLMETMERGQLQLENTVISLGTIYSQLLLLEARDVDSGRTQRLNQDISDQVAALSDVVSTIDELYKKSAEV